MSRSSFSLLSKVVLATAVAITTSGNSTIGTAVRAGQIAENQGQKLLVEKPALSDRDREAVDKPNSRGASPAVEIPESIRDAVLKDIQERSRLQGTELRITQASQQTWLDACLGVGDEDVPCAEAVIPGWVVLVTSQQRQPQYWVYRTDASGTTVKLDEGASKTITALRISETRVQRANNRLTQTADRNRQPEQQSASDRQNSDRTTAIRPETTTQPIAARRDDRTTAIRPETTTQPIAARRDDRTTAIRPETTTQPTAARRDDRTTAIRPETTTQQTAARRDDRTTAIRPETTTQQTAARRDDRTTAIRPETTTQQIPVRQETRTQQIATRRETANQQTAVRRETRNQQVAVRRETQASFKDVSAEYWAKDFINELADRKIILGYPDGTYRPNELVTRAEFAAMISLAFKKPKIREVVVFKDVPTSLWYHSYFQEAYERGFINVESRNVLKPLENVSRLEVLTTLARGLKYSPSGPTDTILQVYSDASAIPSNLRSLVAAATEQGFVINYPKANLLKPKKQATRAEVAAMIYQAMVSDGQVANISSPYRVGKVNNSTQQ